MTLTREELCELTTRMLDQQELDYGRGDDDPLLLVVRAEGDQGEDLPLFIQFDEIQQADGPAWPVVLLDIAVMEGVDSEALPGGRIAALNDEAIVGKLAIDSDGRLAAQHAMVGWPGTVEYRVAVESLIATASEFRSRLEDEVSGSEPATYDSVVDG